MKVWKVLTNSNGSKSGNVDRYTQYSLAGVVLPLLFLTNSFIAAIFGIVAVFMISYFAKRYFNGRADWLEIWFRLLFKPQGSWNLNERDKNGKKQ
ncbi:MAG TPA: hypothetical protein PLW37_08805 [bacterium]|nr:hypothetical protein [bacterium]HQB09955.1 hypothetical protein [bacterium]